MVTPPHTFADLKDMVTHQFSMSFEAEGFSPLVGKIFALLIFAPEPLSLQDMAEKLGVSKAAVSVQVRTLERNSMCIKLTMNSDRRDYYYISDEVTVIAFRAVRQKFELLTQRIDMTVSMMKEISGLQDAERPEYDAGLRRLKESAAMYRLMLSRFDGIEDEWLAIRQSLDSPSDS
ncbi:GbsR/MarR family transcriptional regulator [Paenibacillus sp. YYML68]|uniref:GbsR/MarR family transcriptional regulator n=1 Tax=Paenibacillus sp. YYML68 TaxID=2909250 RepID=UPI0024924420|nr:MarR family transcriptional regulator [Paenibacillus sp. YYML68]